MPELLCGGRSSSADKQTLDQLTDNHGHNQETDPAEKTLHNDIPTPGVIKGHASRVVRWHREPGQPKTWLGWLEERSGRMSEENVTIQDRDLLGRLSSYF